MNLEQRLWKKFEKTSWLFKIVTYFVLISIIWTIFNWYDTKKFNVFIIFSDYYIPLIIFLVSAFLTWKHHKLRRGLFWIKMRDNN